VAGDWIGNGLGCGSVGGGGVGAVRGRVRSSRERKEEGYRVEDAS